MTETKIILSGCNGRMGRIVSNLIKSEDDMSIIAGVDPKNCIQGNSYPVYSTLSDCKHQTDVIIDFSVPKALGSTLQYSKEKKIALVLATTGYSNDQMLEIGEASKLVPIFQAANMSLGINTLLKLVERAVTILGNITAIEIVEKHHGNKTDSPSGTALMILKVVQKKFPDKKPVYGRSPLCGKRENDEIGIHSIRGGTITGEHSILFIGNNEVIELHHEVLSKSVFIEGTINATRFIRNQVPGKIYGMNDLL